VIGDPRLERSHACNPFFLQTEISVEDLPKRETGGEIDIVARPEDKRNA
jgi:hypothetical protein